MLRQRDTTSLSKGSGLCRGPLLIVQAIGANHISIETQFVSNTQTTFGISEYAALCSRHWGA